MIKLVKDIITESRAKMLNFHLILDISNIHTRGEKILILPPRPQHLRREAGPGGRQSCLAASRPGAPPPVPASGHQPEPEHKKITKFEILLKSYESD